VTQCSESQLFAARVHNVNSYTFHRYHLRRSQYFDASYASLTTLSLFVEFEFLPSGDHEQYYLLEFDAGKSGRISNTFRRNILTPSSGLKSKPDKQQAELCLVLTG
jgi:hypothetical protein